MQTVITLVYLLSAVTQVTASGGCREIVQNTYTGSIWSVYGPTPVQYEKSIDSLKLSVRDEVNKLAASLDKKVEMFNLASDDRRHDLEEIFRAYMRQIVHSTDVFERLLASANTTTLQSEFRELGLKMSNFQSELRELNSKVDLIIPLLKWVQDALKNGFILRTEVGFLAMLVAGFIVWVICKVFIRDPKKRSQLITEFGLLVCWYLALLVLVNYFDFKKASSFISSIPLVGTVWDAFIAFITSLARDSAEVARHAIIACRSMQLVSHACFIVYDTQKKRVEAVVERCITYTPRDSSTHSDTAVVQEDANTAMQTAVPTAVPTDERPPASAPLYETLVSQPGAVVARSEPAGGESVQRRKAPSTRRLRSHGPAPQIPISGEWDCPAK
jgi:hypothetical protein